MDNSTVVKSGTLAPELMARLSLSGSEFCRFNNRSKIYVDKTALIYTMDLH